MHGIYWKHNRSIVQIFLKTHLEELRRQFLEYSKNAATVSSSDIPMVLRIGLYLDNITLHETKEDSEELFNKPDSYKKIMSHLQQFLKDRLESEASLETAQLSFNQFL